MKFIREYPLGEINQVSFDGLQNLVSNLLSQGDVSFTDETVGVEGVLMIPAKNAKYLQERQVF